MVEAQNVRIPRRKANFVRPFGDIINFRRADRVVRPSQNIANIRSFENIVNLGGRTKFAPTGKEKILHRTKIRFLKFALFAMSHSTAPKSVF